MRRATRMTRHGPPPWAAVLLPALLLLAAGAAAQPLLDVGEGSGTVGDTVLVPVELTGLTADVWSWELDMSWTWNRATFTGVVEAGTLSDGWLVDHQPGSGTVTVGGAGTTPLAGDGTLIFLEFLLGPNSGNTYIYLNAALFNEGDPVPDRANGYLQVAALPSVSVGPASGMIVVGDSLQYYANGGTAPYTFTSSDPPVADFDGDWLHALWPGFVQVTAEDAHGYTGTTTGQLEVRAFTLEVMDTAADQGDVVLVPIELRDPGPYGITAGEFEVSWTMNRANFLGVETAGTLVGDAGWSPPLTLDHGDGSLYLSAAGTTPLAGPGVFVYLRFEAIQGNWLYITPGIFNEIYPAVPDNGYLSVNVPPALGMTPNGASMLVGDLQQFEVTGTYVEPLTWTLDDPALGDVDSGGHVLALAEGVTRLRVTDSVGAEAVSGDIVICSLAVPALDAWINADETVAVPVNADRDVTGLGIHSLELEVAFDPDHVEFLGAVSTGTTTHFWGLPTSHVDGDRVRVSHAGATPLQGCASALVYLEFRGLPGIAPYTGLALTDALFNEGTPCLHLNEREPCPYSGVELPAVAGLVLRNSPNPFNPRTTLEFMVPRTGPAELAVFNARGERVCVPFSGRAEGGRTLSVDWHGRDAEGRAVASGVYYARLDAGGERIYRKMALLR